MSTVPELTDDKLVWVYPNLDFTFDEAWFEPDYLRNYGLIKGKEFNTSAYYFSVSDRSLQLRQYTKDGWLKKRLGLANYFSKVEKTRAWQEAKLLDDMLQMGLPVPKPVAIRVIKTGRTYQAEIITDRISQSLSLHNILRKRGMSEEMWHEIGQAIRLMHDNDIWHQNLSPNTVQVGPSREVWFSNFDYSEKMTSGQSVVRKRKQRSMKLLKKKLVDNSKRSLDYHFTEENWAQLLNGYGSATI